MSDMLKERDLVVLKADGVSVPPLLGRTLGCCWPPPTILWITCWRLRLLWPKLELLRIPLALEEILTPPPVGLKEAGPLGEALVAGLDIVTKPESSVKEISGFFLQGTEKSRVPDKLTSFPVCVEGRETGLTPSKDFKAEEV